MSKKLALTTEEKILQVGRRLFSTKGYAATSMSDIASEVGITKASLYHHFLGKEALYVQILLELIAKIHAVYVFDDTQSPQQNIERVLRETICISRTYGSMLQTVDTSQLNPQSSACSAVFQDLQSFDADVQQFLRQCGISEPELASHVLHSSTHAYMQRGLCGDSVVSEGVYAQYMSNLLVRGGDSVTSY